ncbi:MAG: exosortase/archaeosortase family protein, partial [Planctomycetes bacterium]|nr:exosortase/archaeosortase family protein [Planctomycetota bacterium]
QLPPTMEAACGPLRLGVMTTVRLTTPLPVSVTVPEMGKIKRCASLSRRLGVLGARLLVMLGGVALFFGGWPIVKLIWLPVVYLIFAIPFPDTIHTKISTPMREIASLVTALILNVLPHVDAQSANVVIYGTYKGDEFNPLNVADACSGMRLLRAFVALGVAMAYLEYRPLVHRIILLLSTIPIAIICNIVRVFLTGVIYIYVREDLATGTPHTLLGIAMLLLAFGLYGLLAWVMESLFIDDEANEQHILMVQREGENS